MNRKNEGDRIRPEPRPFSAVLQEINRGNLHAELTHVLNSLVEDVRAHMKPGTLTIKMKLEPKNDGEIVIVHADCEAKPPKPVPGSTFFFVDPDCNLIQQDPKQMTLDDLYRKPRETPGPARDNNPQAANEPEAPGAPSDSEN